MLLQTQLNFPQSWWSRSDSPLTVYCSSARDLLRLRGGVQYSAAGNTAY